MVICAPASRAGAGERRGARGWPAWCGALASGVVLGALACAPAPRPAAPRAVGAPAPAASPAPACEPLAVDPFEPERSERVATSVPPIEDATVLAPFFRAAARLLRGRATAPVRIAVHGDSNLTRDWLTGYLRRALQQRYGDAGHGFVAIGSPWSWYRHMDVVHGEVPGAWRPLAISTHRVADRAYGLSGIAAESRHPGARAWVATAPPGAPVGGAATRFGVFYLRQPGGGALELHVGGERRATVDTSAESLGVGVERLTLAGGPQRVELVALRRGVRLLGAFLERDPPGFVVDSYGIGGVSFFDLGGDDPAFTNAMLEERPADLHVLWIGTNLHGAAHNAASIRAIVGARRALRGDLPLLIVSPPDHTRRPSDATSDAGYVRVVARLADHARENGCAYWDLREAMGGEGSMSRFALRGFAAPDLHHLSESGSRLLATHLLAALWDALRAHLERDPSAGCAGASPTRP